MKSGWIGVGLLAVGAAAWIAAFMSVKGKKPAASEPGKSPNKEQPPQKS